MASGSVRDRLKATGSLLLSAFREWIRDRCEGIAAAMAFNALLAAAPFFVFVLLLADAGFGQRWTEAHVLPILLAWVGPRGTGVLWQLLVHEHIKPETVFALGIVGAIGLAYGASAFFLQMQDALETIWNVRRAEARIPVQLRKRLLGLLYVIVSAIIVVAGMTLAGLVLSIGPLASGRAVLNSSHIAGEALIAFLVFWALSSFWLKVLPPVRLTWRQILPWAALIAALHLLGRMVLTWRASEQDPASGVDVAESLILVILWFHYACMVFLYGAQLMKVYLHRYRGMSLAEFSSPDRPRSPPMPGTWHRSRHQSMNQPTADLRSSPLNISSQCSFGIRFAAKRCTRSCTAEAVDAAWRNGTRDCNGAYAATRPPGSCPDE